MDDCEMGKYDLSDGPKGRAKSLMKAATSKSRSTQLLTKSIDEVQMRHGRKAAVREECHATCMHTDCVGGGGGRDRKGQAYRILSL